MQIEHRSIPMCVILTIITFGIYGIYWLIVMTNESNSLAPDNATTGGGVAFLLCIITFGIYLIYWNYKLGAKVDEMKGTDGNTGILYLIIGLIIGLIGFAIINFGLIGFGIINCCLAQSEINKHADA